MKRDNKISDAMSSDLRKIIQDVSNGQEQPTPPFKTELKEDDFDVNAEGGFKLEVKILAHDIRQLSTELMFVKFQVQTIRLDYASFQEFTDQITNVANLLADSSSEDFFKMANCVDEKFFEKEQAEIDAMQAALNEKKREFRVNVFDQALYTLQDRVQKEAGKSFGEVQDEACKSLLEVE